MDRLSNVVTILSAALIVAVLSSVRRAHIRRALVSWLAAGVAMLVISQYSALRDRLAAFIALRTVRSPYCSWPSAFSCWSCTVCRS